jgi:hypothetical protein
MDTSILSSQRKIMNVIEWLNATAAFMAADRPDVYDKETAVEELSVAMESLREYDLPVSVMSFTSYFLIRVEDEGVEEFNLSKKITSVNLFMPEEECYAWSHVDGIDLPHIMTALDDPDVT